MQHLNAQQGLVNLFTSDSYRLLCLLESLQAETVDGPRVRELADLFGASARILTSTPANIEREIIRSDFSIIVTRIPSLPSSF